jgi:hypothetical protein
MKNKFQNECGFTSFNQKSLSLIKEFYKSNKEIIDGYSRNIEVKSFETSEKTGILYPKAKIIDMYGFCKGEELSAKSKTKKSKYIKGK